MSDGPTGSRRGAKAEQKERTHAEILASAARLLRERGIAGMSVSDVMSGAGLTVGGFYAHFSSKEELVRDTLRSALRDKWQALLAGTEHTGDRAALVLRRYLSRAHRDETAEGCPLPAVVGALATGEAAGKEILAEELATSAAALEELLPALPGSRGQRALGLIALMYGGLSLARALRGTELSDEILRACRACGRAALRGFAVPDDA